MRKLKQIEYKPKFETLSTKNQRPKTVKGETNMKTSKKSKYAPTRTEVIKTVIIAVLVTAILAFTAGIAYANKQHSEIEAVKSAINVEPSK